MLPSLFLVLGSVATVACKPRGHRMTTTLVNVSCPIALDGRVPVATNLKALDTANGIFNPDYVKGNNVSWSEALLFPADANASRFDTVHKPVEVTINNASVFMKQYGFRRAGLQFAKDNNTASPGYVGKKTLHWSIMQDPKRALNTSHEYLVVWHEAADYSANQFNFQIGKMIDKPTLDAKAWKLFDRNMTLLWSTAAVSHKWQNFAITLDIAANTIQMHYSAGTDALKAATKVLKADLSGDGQYQIGVLKKPTGTSDVANSGHQEAPFSEGLIYGSIFVEDSTNGCITR